MEKGPTPHRTAHELSVGTSPSPCRMRSVGPAQTCLVPPPPPHFISPTPHPPNPPATFGTDLVCAAVQHVKTMY